MGDLTLIGSTLFGTTSGGGSSDAGMVFSVPLTGGTPTTVASFDGLNGFEPSAGLTLSADGSTFYGTTASGGGANFDGVGNVFSVPVKGGTPTSLATFNGSNGNDPESTLTLIGSTLYGTTSSGGANDDGTLFSVPVSGGAITTLVNFNGTNGSDPESGLTLIGSTLYGTTSGGGASDYGTVFSLTPNSPAAVPEASSVVSFALLLLGGLGALIFRAKRSRAAVLN